ncbi:MAG: MOSC domain-containing protein [Spirochaetae bacterium HGW-Spirochaetae-7]|jgi:cyclic pyranopterin phosphate synthase|nr:MAG: MOSC domain-containing protein [Spirochaetae bacterium HGW-Spirochaetae-7]
MEAGDEKAVAQEGQFEIVSINVSAGVGTRKDPVDGVELRMDHGIVGDAHARNWHRQVSMLADEDVESMRGKGVDLDPGIFAENITTRGVDLSSLPVGTRLFVGEAMLELTQIGKECHHGCAIFQAVGDCVMPRKGIFAKVIKEGWISRESSCHYRI